MQKIRVLRSLQTSCVFTLAYIMHAVERFFQLPQWLFFVTTLFAITIASIKSWEPFFWEKIALAIGPQTPTSFVRMIRTTHMFGDPLLAERIYLSILPGLNSAEQQQIRQEAYPYDTLQALQSFWTNVLQLQPSSREAYVALTMLAYSFGDGNRAQALIQELQRIEPNDPRIPLLKNFSDRL